MVAPFVERKLQEPSFIQRLFGRSPPDNALREVRNELARVRALAEFRQESLALISEKYRLNIAIKYRKGLEDIYREALEHALKDRHLSEDEVQDFAALKMALKISDAAAEHIREELTQAVYGAASAEAVADGRLSPEERAGLTTLEQNLAIPQRVARKIYEDAAQQRLQAKLDHAASDERLSPDEDSELAAISASLGVEIQMSHRSRALYERLRLYWLIENGDVPTVAADIRMQRGEACYASHQVNWYENRTVTKRYQYGGLTGRVRIAKGIYLRLGDIAIRPVREDVLKHIDSGQVYLTNKRLIFMGQRKNTTIRLNRILDFNPFKNGVEIDKDSGKPVFLGFESDLDLFALKLDRALRDAAG